MTIRWIKFRVQIKSQKLIRTQGFPSPNPFRRTGELWRQKANHPSNESQQELVKIKPACSKNASIEGAKFWPTKSNESEKVTYTTYGCTKNDSAELNSLEFLEVRNWLFITTNNLTKSLQESFEIIINRNYPNDSRRLARYVHASFFHCRVCEMWSILRILYAMNTTQ